MRGERIEQIGNIIAHVLADQVQTFRSERIHIGLTVEIRNFLPDEIGERVRAHLTAGKALGNQFAGGQK